MEEGLDYKINVARFVIAENACIQMYLHFTFIQWI